MIRPVTHCFEQPFSHSTVVTLLHYSTEYSTYFWAFKPGIGMSEILAVSHFHIYSLQRSNFVSDHYYKLSNHYKIGCFSLWGINYCNIFFTLEWNGYFSEMREPQWLIQPTNETSKGCSLQNEMQQAVEIWQLVEMLYFRVVTGIYHLHAFSTLNIQAIFLACCLRTPETFLSTHRHTVAHIQKATCHTACEWWVRSLLSTNTHKVMSKCPSWQVYS